MLVPHGYFQLAFVTEISSSAVPKAGGSLDIISKFTGAYTRFIWKDVDFLVYVLSTKLYS